MRIFTRIKSLTERKFFYPVFSLLVMLAAYGVALLHPGFFWDDWQAVYLARAGSPADWWQFFAFDRPISAWTYIITMPVLRLHPLAWQFFTLLVRWAGMLAFVWGMQGLWPQRTWQARWMGLLLVVYPGFSQQPIAVAYSQHFITYALFLVSLALMIWAVRKPRLFWLYTLPGAFLALCHMLTMEYFAGLELLRPVILWFMLRRKGEKFTRTVWKVFRQWLPYFMAFALFLSYRFVFYPRLSATPDPNAPLLLETLLNQPLQGLLQILQLALQDFLQVTLFAWVGALSPGEINLAVTFTLFTWLVGLSVAAVSAWLFQSKPVESEADSPAGADGFVGRSLLVGVLGVLLGGLPVWITNRQVIVGAWSDRFTLAPMFGAVILVVCLAEWLAGQRSRKAVALAVLLGLAVATQMQTVNKYRLHWELQRQYFWQFSWRVPGLETGTAIGAPELPFSYMSGISMGFAFNTLYDARPQAGQPVPYWFIEALRYRGSLLLPDFTPAQPILYTGFRNITFESSTDHMLGVNFNAARGCLRVMDPVYQSAPVLSDYPVSEGEVELYAISHPGQITEEGQPSPLLKQIYGPEPAHDWCYYYEKADLARQFGRWEQAAALGAEAASLGYQPRLGAEMVPFIEAHAHTGQWEEALGDTRTAVSLSPQSQPLLCQTWMRIQTDLPTNTTASGILRELGCK